MTLLLEGALLAAYFSAVFFDQPDTGAGHDLAEERRPAILTRAKRGTFVKTPLRVNTIT